MEEAMKNSVLGVDPELYGLLLARRLPGVIRTEEENERLIAELEERAISCKTNYSMHSDCFLARPVFSLMRAALWVQPPHLVSMRWTMT